MLLVVVLIERSMSSSKSVATIITVEKSTERINLAVIVKDREGDVL